MQGFTLRHRRAFVSMLSLGLLLAGIVVVFKLHSNDAEDAASNNQGALFALSYTEQADLGDSPLSFELKAELLHQRTSAVDNRWVDSYQMTHLSLHGSMPLDERILNQLQTAFDIYRQPSGQLVELRTEIDMDQDTKMILAKLVRHLDYQLETKQAHQSDENGRYTLDYSLKEGRPMVLRKTGDRKLGLGSQELIARYEFEDERKHPYAISSDQRVKSLFQNKVVEISQHLALARLDRRPSSSLRISQHAAEGFDPYTIDLAITRDRAATGSQTTFPELRAILAESQTYQQLSQNYQTAFDFFQSHPEKLYLLTQELHLLESNSLLHHFYLSVLVKLSSANAQRVLLNYLKDSAGTQEKLGTALLYLNQSVSAQGELIRFLIELAQDPSIQAESLRTRSMLALGSLAQVAEDDAEQEVFRYLFAKLKSPQSEDELLLTIAALGNTRDLQIYSTLHPLFDHASPAIRSEAYYALRHLEIDLIRDRINAGLRDPNADTRLRVLKLCRARSDLLTDSSFDWGTLRKNETDERVLAIYNKILN